MSRSSRRRPRRLGLKRGPVVFLALLAGVVVFGLVELSLRSSPAPKSAEGSPAPSPALLGASLNIIFNDARGTPAWREMQLAAAEAHGVRLARSDALWAATEPVAPVSGVHSYHWEFNDRVASGLATHGMRWLAVLDFSPVWATADPRRLHAPPVTSGDYAAYAAAFARRYGRNGEFWRSHPKVPYRPVSTFEIWNEPDNPTFWDPRPDPAAYGELYLAARRAIHAVEPRAQVVVGGLVPNSGFVTEMYRAHPELRGLVDGVALHPYGADPDRVFAHVRELRATLRALDQATVPILVTEYGWQTVAVKGLQFTAPANKPSFIARTADVLARSDCGIQAVILYSWVTAERDPASADDWYGVYRPEGGDTPSSRALARVLDGSKRGSKEVRICS